MGRDGARARWKMAVGLVGVAALALMQGCAADATEDNTKSGSDSVRESGNDSEGAIAGKNVVRSMLGVADARMSGGKSNGKLSARGTRYASAVEATIRTMEQSDARVFERFGVELASKDAKRVLRAYPAMRAKVVAAAGSKELRTALRSEEAFSGVKITSLSSSSSSSSPSIGTGGLHPTDVGADGIPNLGKGADGKFGDGKEGAGAALGDSLDMAVDPFTPWITLGKIDSGEIVPDPDSRLGAYAATKGYPPGSVGEAVHNAIGGIYIALGNYGQEKIGRVFNSPEAKALYMQPVDSPSGLLMAQIEERYWQNVRAEDGWSPGGQLGSLFSPAVRDMLQKYIFSTDAPEGVGKDGNGDGTGGDGTGTGTGEGDGTGNGEEQLSKTDCGDKSDGWWCLDAGTGTGWMAYCAGKQVSGGCACGGCTTAGVKASCSSPTPPAACESE